MMRAQRQAPRKVAGFTLIELMVSIAIGLMVLSGLLGVFVAQSRHRTDLDLTARLLDNGRHALEIIADDLRHAGYYGEFDPSGVTAPGVLPDPCATTVPDIAAALGLHVQGIDDADDSTRPTCVPSIVTGSDILVVRRVDPSPVAVAAIGGGNATRYLQASLCESDTQTFVLSISPGDFTLRNKNCNAGNFSVVRAYTTNIYFVAPENVAGDGIPTLKRAELNAAGTWTVTALAEGIEAMQIDFGVDTSGDGMPDAHHDCSACAPIDWRNVTTARIHLLVRHSDRSYGHNDTKVYALGSHGTLGPFNDAYKRHAYAEFVRLVNASGRRETP